VEAIENRKADIIRRKANVHKDREERDFKIKAMEERALKREAELNAKREEFNAEHKDEIDLYEDWKKKQDDPDHYGDEDEEEDGEPKEKEPPKMPEFPEQEILDKFDEEYPEIEI